MNKAVFWDRDGTINIEKNYLYRIEDFEFIDGVLEKLRHYHSLGYLNIVVTNQAGIARGYYSESDVVKLHEQVNKIIYEQIGITIDAFYFCPHHPVYGMGQYKKDCSCRKPKPGMLLRAIKDFNIDPGQSLIIGDKPWDIEAGMQCEVRGFYIQEILSVD